MSELGDYRQALALNAEVIEWNAAHDETLTLSVSRYLRGIILHETHEYDAALVAFANARALSVVLGDEQGIAFADMRVCGVLIDLGDYPGARKRCDDALRIFAASGTIDVVKQTRSFLAQIDLAEGRAARALAALNVVLANGAVDMPPREVTPLYKLRSDANAALGNTVAAYADLKEYMRRYAATNETRRLRQVAALHARFEIDREIDRNAAAARARPVEAAPAESCSDVRCWRSLPARSWLRCSPRCSSARVSPAARGARQRRCAHGSAEPAPHGAAGRGCAGRFQAPRRATDHRADRPRSLQDDQ
jgi:hypothetical protein